MKKLLLSFMLTFVVSFIYAQEGTPQKFKLLGDTFSTELKFEANPVGTEKIQVWIIPEGRKPSENEKIIKYFTIIRGKQSLKIDVSQLSKGEYTFSILQGLKGGVFFKNFRKE